MQGRKRTSERSYIHFETLFLDELEGDKSKSETKRAKRKVERKKTKNNNNKKQNKHTLRAGFEPAREDPIGFQVQRLNHSAIAAGCHIMQNE